MPRGATATSSVSRRPSKRLTREEKKAQTRAALIAAASKIFARRGFHGAALEDVAEEAGFSKGAVYSNFSSKEELFLTLLEQRTQDWNDAIARLFRSEDSVEMGLLKSGQILSDVLERERDWCLLFVELWTYASRDPKLESRVAAMYEQARTQLAEVIDATTKELGVVLPLPPDEIAAAAIALNDGFALQKLVDSKRFAPNFLGQLFTLFFGGLAMLGSGPESEIGSRARLAMNAATGVPDSPATAGRRGRRQRS